MSTSDPDPVTNVTGSARPFHAAVVAAAAPPALTAKAAALPPARAIAPVPSHPYKHPSHLFPQPLPTGNPSAGTLNRFGHYQDQPVVYPLDSPGQGFPTRPGRPPPQSHLDQIVTVAAHMPMLAGRVVQGHFDPVQYVRTSQAQSHHPHLRHRPHPGNATPIGSAPTKGFPVFVQPKVAPAASSLHGIDEHKKTRDDFAVIRDRKVRITEGASLYALSRSWLRNGGDEQNQPLSDNFVKPLPRPLPPRTTDTNMLAKDNGEEGQKEEEETESIEHLSANDLLQRHIKRAKKVRARLREDRLKQIRRYSNRLALLLPPITEHCRNDNL